MVSGAGAYGGMVHGTPDSVLGAIRTSIRSTLAVKSKGGSATLEMMASNTKQIDHSFRANRDPLVAWALAAYNGENHETRKRACRNSISQVGLAPSLESHAWSCWCGYCHFEAHRVEGSLS